MTLYQLYYGLLKSERSELRIKISEACGWAYGTFYYKLKHGNFSKLEFEAIQSIVDDYLLSNQLTNTTKE